jgi:hypothetical protein
MTQKTKRNNIIDLPLLSAFILITLMVQSISGNENTELKKTKLPETLAEVATLDIGPAIDVATDGNTLCVVGRGYFITADISDPGHPKETGRLPLRGGRQVVISNHIAYITARDPGKGVFIIDVRHPQKPELLCHYDADVSSNTTGIAISGNILCITGSGWGLEFADVRDPRKPVYLSTLPVGEVQSVAFRGGIVYAPIHHRKELVTVDAHNPCHPLVIGRAPLDGYGDGVAVSGKYCYVATGHHDSSTGGLAQTMVTPDNPGWGKGHGLEVFDISSPDKPVLTGMVKFPPFCIVGPDWWSVKVAGHYAYVADGINGANVIDVSNPAKPEIIARNLFYRKKPWEKNRWPHEPERKERFPSDIPSFATNLIDYTCSIVTIKDYIFVANLCGFENEQDIKGGINVLAAPGIATSPAAWDNTFISIDPAKKETDPRIIYQTGSSIHAIDFFGDTALVAAGSGGLHLLQLNPEVKILHKYGTEDIVMDVRVKGNLVYVAEGLAGLSIWRFSGGGSLSLLGRYHPQKGIPVQSVVVPYPGKYALLDANGIEIVDVTDPSHPVLRLHHLGNYGFGMSENLINDRYALAFAANTPVFRYDIYGGPLPARDGIEYSLSVWGISVIVTGNDKLLIGSGISYRLIGRGETRKFGELPQYSARISKGADVGSGGKLQLIDSMLFSIDSKNNRVNVLDISSLENPRFLDTFKLVGKPSWVAIKEGYIFIPGGYAGLYKISVPPKSVK